MACFLLSDVSNIEIKMQQPIIIIIHLPSNLLFMAPTETSGGAGLNIGLPFSVNSTLSPKKRNQTINQSNTFWASVQISFPGPSVLS